MQISRDFLDKVDEGSCIPYRNNEVVCVSQDLPLIDSAPIELEIDREGNNVLLRNIILDKEDDPLYVEYFIDAMFLNSISKSKSIIILFVDRSGEVLKKLVIYLTEDDIQLIRSEMRVGDKGFTV
ncbi:hypothetical protein [Metallosphaera hakonensis]|uniref:Uncharacterized protein n=1 Tax=Metallosphaera hakonensis JCM 8857 = DSM 7519 TaxID=1293036 RepID=A0A2U9IT82_9CREN|nr:hypothetical protein [Metallosphaera hakonensis]AWR99260.1 hypothetical protein DFR87_05580 [Metallosphaera hakonensis JCM 8857 = DSM 7519]